MGSVKKQVYALAPGTPQTKGSPERSDGDHAATGGASDDDGGGSTWDVQQCSARPAR
ncbi:protein of unknown function [Streptomyces sp. KY75]|nr:protein of unknown function [Streptomyces sp. KY75]CAD5990527.1 protein of unknown function [Streptomyces sp. KY70]